jgi:hypothetical protein
MPLHAGYTSTLILFSLCREQVTGDAATLGGMIAFKRATHFTPKQAMQEEASRSRRQHNQHVCQALLARCGMLVRTPWLARGYVHAQANEGVSRMASLTLCSLSLSLSKARGSRLAALPCCLQAQSHKPLVLTSSYVLPFAQHVAHPSQTFRLQQQLMCLPQRRRSAP